MPWANTARTGGFNSTGEVRSPTSPSKIKSMDFTDDGFGGLMKTEHDYSSLNAESRAA